jgi:hypothetical protein
MRHAFGRCAYDYREKLFAIQCGPQGHSDEVGAPVLQQNLTAEIALPTLALFLVSEKPRGVAPAFVSDAASLARGLIPVRVLSLTEAQQLLDSKGRLAIHPRDLQLQLHDGAHRPKRKNFGLFSSDPRRKHRLKVSCLSKSRTTDAFCSLA